MSYHPASSGGRSSSGSGVIMILVCLMISQDHVVKGSCNLFGWEFLMISHHPAKFVGHRDCGKGDMMF